MVWWLYVIIGFIVGAVSSGILTRLFYFRNLPPIIGNLVIVSDPENPLNTEKDYVFLQASNDPDVVRHWSLATLKIIDKTGRK